MGLIINTTVPGGPDGFSAFGPGDDVPEWAARLMGEHCFEDGKHPYPEQESPADDETPAPDREAGVEPARGGPKATRDSWIAFAGEKGFEIPEGVTSRDQIVEAMVKAEIIEAK